MNSIPKSVRRRRRGLSWWMRANEARRWVGFDCETFRGQVKLLAASDGSTIESPTTDEAITFLYEHLPHLADAGTFYNLRFDASAMLRDAALTDPKGVRSGDFVVGDRTAGQYRVHNVPGKALVIGKAGGGAISTARIYDAAQFFPGGLDRAAHQVLGVGKNAAELGVDRVKIGNEAGYYEAHRESIIRYCIQDASLAARLMERFQADVAATVGVYPAAWYSGASIAKSVLLTLGDNPFYGWPTELIDDSIAAFSGGIFDTRVLGRVQGASEYDINAAYPAAIARLPALTSEPEAVTARDPGATLGFYLVRVEYDGLLPYRLEDRKSIIYPVSSKPVYAWLYDVELPDYPSAQIVRGWEWKEDREYYPYAETMRRFYALRGDLRKAADPREGAVKIAMNSTFGAFAETKNGWTRFTNMVYAGRITATTRHLLRAMARAAGSAAEVVSFATDSVTFAGGSEPLTEEPGLGGLKLSFSGADLVTYANGIRIINGRLAKVRGLPRRILVSGQERYLTAGDFLGARGDELSLVGSGPLPLITGIVQGRQKEIASWVETPKKVSLAPNLIRGVPDGPLTFEHLSAHPVRLGRRVVGSSPTFKRLTPPQVVALENNQYPGPFRVEDLEGDET